MPVKPLTGSPGLLVIPDLSPAPAKSTDASSVASGLPRRTLRMRISEVRSIAREVKLLVLESAEGAALPPVESGAHIGVCLPNAMERQYSLIDADPAPAAYRIAVKREASGRGGSRYICDELHVGSTLEITPPANTFPLLESARRSVLIAGGIGITPIWCMAKRLAALGRSFELHYACRSRADAAFLDEISQLPQARLHFDSEAGGPPDIAAICAAAPADAHFYCCGPAPMLAAFEAATANVPAAQRHVEYFTPKFEADVRGGFTVVLARSKREVVVPPGKTILEALRADGVKDLVSSCEEGVCGACETRVLRGIPEHRDSILSEEERAANKTMFICCSGALTDELVLDL
jgi:ferredoxin-NADP reductase